jgi:hypothetical protein
VPKGETWGNYSALDGAASHGFLNHRERELLLDIVTTSCNKKCLNGLPLYMQVSQDLWDKRSITASSNPLSLQLVQEVEAAYEEKSRIEREKAEKLRKEQQEREEKEKEDALLQAAMAQAGSVGVGSIGQGDVSGFFGSPTLGTGGDISMEAAASAKETSRKGSTYPVDGQRKASKANLSATDHSQQQQPAGRLTKAQEREKEAKERAHREGKMDGVIIQHSKPLPLLQEQRDKRRQKRLEEEEAGIAQLDDWDGDDSSTFGLDFTAEDLEEFLHLHHDEDEDGGIAMMADDDDIEF